LKNFKKYLLEA